MASSDPFREVQVERVQPLGPTMQRVTFAPRDRAALPAERPHGGHCRLRFPGRDASAPPQPRAYTYRRWHADGRFDVDFVVHAGDGPAARWLRQVRPGACIGWRHGGPPKICLAAPAPEPTILIADLSGLPVMAALIEQAHPTRRVSLILTVCPDAATDPAPQGRARIYHLPSPEDRRAALAAACNSPRHARLRRLRSDTDAPLPPTAAGCPRLAPLSGHHVGLLENRPHDRRRRPGKAPGGLVRGWACQQAGGLTGREAGPADRRPPSRRGITRFRTRSVPPGAMSAGRPSPRDCRVGCHEKPKSRRAGKRIPRRPSRAFLR